MTDAARQLERACEQWRTLTLAEAQAIAADDWPTVQRCQATKARLQPVITAATDALRQQAAGTSPSARANEQRLRSLVGGLLALERHNQAALAARYRQARQEQAELDGARRRLRQLRRAYTAAPTPGWHSYS